MCWPKKNVREMIEKNDWALSKILHQNPIIQWILKVMSNLVLTDVN